MSVFSARNVLSRHIVIVTTKLIISLLVEVIALRVEEVSTWQHIEAIRVVLSRSVLNLLPRELSNPWYLSRLRCRLAILRKSLNVLLIRSVIVRALLLEPIGLLWRWWLSLILELTIDKTVLSIDLILRINFEQVVCNSETTVTLV